MKRIALSITMSLIALGAVQAQYGRSQQYQLETFVEYTPVNSPMFGASIGQQVGKIHEVGLFYQDNAPYADHSKDVAKGIEKRFYGMYYSGQIRKWKRASFDVKIKAGMAQGGFALTPGFQFDVRPVHNIHLGVGVFSRGIMPSGVLSLRFDIGR